MNHQILIPDGDIIGELTLPKAGGRPVMADFEATYIRDVTQADLEVILAPQETPVNVLPELREIRAPHHSIARLLAQGRSHVEIGLVTGYTPGYIGMLQDDPAFQELLAYYTHQKDLVFADVLERMKVLGLNSLEELQKRMEEKPEEWSKRELMELTELMLGKAGAGAGPGAGGGSGGPSVAVSVSFVSPAASEKFPPSPSNSRVIEGEIISSRDPAEEI